MPKTTRKKRAHDHELRCKNLDLKRQIAEQTHANAKRKNDSRQDLIDINPIHSQSIDNTSINRTTGSN